MGKSWENHRKIMGKPWESGKTDGKTKWKWENEWENPWENQA